ncbi:hypothetical protein AAES_61922 [Amazona aestiva]|uniref:Uncharacterized protein n=1 Tax=Amazona aestiva TaxID=12930 RepID=A0A0Q3RCI5_AMAAE|nr:hypothetical protein AAES_61922 [Amazona aestiva]
MPSHQRVSSAWCQELQCHCRAKDGRLQVPIPATASVLNSKSYTDLSIINSECIQTPAAGVRPFTSSLTEIQAYDKKGRNKSKVHLPPSVWPQITRMNCLKQAALRKLRRIIFGIKQIPQDLDHVLEGNRMAVDPSSLLIFFE